MGKIISRRLLPPDDPIYKEGVTFSNAGWIKSAAPKRTDQTPPSSGMDETRNMRKMQESMDASLVEHHRPGNTQTPEWQEREKERLDSLFGPEMIPARASEYLDAFTIAIPWYCQDRSGHLVGPPEQWQSAVISYALYLGLGIFAIEPEFARKLASGLTPGARVTSDLVLPGLRELRYMPDIAVQRGDLWDTAVGFLNDFMLLTSPETSGPTADEELVRERAPFSGFVPALRLPEMERSIANRLYASAIHERHKCSEEELAARISWMKRLVDDVIGPL